MPRTVIGGVIGNAQRKANRLAKRWSTIARDSFNRVSDDKLGNADTGHNWSALGAGNTWSIKSGRARLRLPGAAGDASRAYMETGLADATVRVRLTFQTASANGVGLFFRGDVNGQGLALAYCGAGTWKWQKITTNATPPPAYTITTLASFSGTALVPGATYLLKVVASGATLTAFLDGAQINQTTQSFNQSESQHGLFCDTGETNLFDQFQVVRS